MVLGLLGVLRVVTSLLGVDGAGYSKVIFAGFQVFFVFIPIVSAAFAALFNVVEYRTISYKQRYFNTFLWTYMIIAVLIKLLLTWAKVSDQFG